MIGPPTGDISFRILHPWQLTNVPLKKREPFQKEHSFVFRGRSIYQDPTTKDPRVLKKKEAEIPSYRIFHFHISKIYFANQKQLKAAFLETKTCKHGGSSLILSKQHRHPFLLPHWISSPVAGNSCSSVLTMVYFPLVGVQSWASLISLAAIILSTYINGECIVISFLKHTMKTSFLELLIINRYQIVVFSERTWSLRSLDFWGICMLMLLIEKACFATCCYDCGDTNHNNRCSPLKIFSTASCKWLPGIEWRESSGKQT